MSTQTTPRDRTGCLKAGEASLPLTKMEIAGAITGLLHRTKVCQTFVNDHDVPLEAVYIHPLPPRACVHGFRLVIGNRVVEGKVQERAQARQAYQTAVAQGHRAALMEEGRSDVFTTTVGNIAAGEQVSISFELSGPLEFLGSSASLQFPLVVPEVYVSGSPLGGGDVGDGTAVDTDSVPDASRITPPRLAQGAANPVDLRLCFTVDPAGLQLEKVESLCHFAKTRQRDDGIFEISLLPGVERMDHDFAVRLRLREGSLQSTIISDPETGCFALTVVPPVGAARALPARDVVIVLDRSGSMQGWSMTAARRAAARIVESLTPQDRFAIVAFDNSCELMDPFLVLAEARHKERAQEFLARIDARGGTEARQAIERALKLLSQETAADKTVLFITDGDVGNDAELVARSAAGVRISTVGIGNNSRAGVLQSMAKTSGGLCSLIPEESTLEEALRDLHQRLGRPHWMGLSVSGLSVNDQAPRFWDVWEGVPTTFFGKSHNLGEEVSVEGWLAGQGQHAEKVAVRRRDDLVIHRSWARARLLDLDDLWTIGKASEAELVALSVEAQVLCRFTAFAAIDSSEVVANAEERKTVVQPVEPTLRKKMAPAKQLLGGACGGKPSLARPMAAPSPMPAAPLCQAPAGTPMSFAEAPPADAFSSGEDCFGATGDACDGQAASSVPVQRSGALRSEPLRERSNMEAAVRSQGLFRGGGPAHPGPLGARPKRDDSSKDLPASAAAGKAQKASIWTVLLEMLDRLVAAPRDEQDAILDLMVERLGEFCRTAPRGSAGESLGKQVMSSLVDLAQAAAQDEREALIAAIRKALELP
jgi:Ca-activated chloride channel family protein